MLKPRVKVATFLASTGALLVAVFTCVYWGDLRVHYHLAALRRERDHILEVLGASADTARGIALREFIETSEGKSQVLETYVDEMLRAGARTSFGAIAWKGELRCVAFWVMEGKLRVRVHAVSKNGTQTSVGPSIRLEESVRLRCEALQVHLGRIGYAGHGLVSYPGITFTVYPTKSYSPCGSLFDGTICVLTIRAESPDERQAAIRSLFPE